MKKQQLTERRLTIDTATRVIWKRVFASRKPSVNGQTSMVKRPQSRGAVLLIAVLVASVALAVGFGVYNRTYKELLFGSYWRQTQIAFSSADSGLECALYWELHPTTPATCFGGISVNTSLGGASWDTSIPGNAGTFKVDVPGAGCVDVIIDWDSVLLATTTTARGYNDACSSTNPRRVERGLKASI